MTVPKHTGGGLDSDPSYRFVDCFDDALKLLRAAADRWAVGDPVISDEEALHEAVPGAAIPSRSRFPAIPP